MSCRDILKVEKVINSCETMEQLKVAMIYKKLFERKCEDLYIINILSWLIRNREFELQLNMDV